MNSIWMTALLPPALTYVHLVDVRREERSLAETFGEQYERYKRSVRRYL